MSELTDKTDELFMAASRSDDDLGYPHMSLCSVPEVVCRFATL